MDFATRTTDGIAHRLEVLKYNFHLVAIDGCSRSQSRLFAKWPSSDRHVVVIGVPTCTNLLTLTNTNVCTATCPNTKYPCSRQPSPGTPSVLRHDGHPLMSTETGTRVSRCETRGQGSLGGEAIAKQVHKRTVLSGARLSKNISSLYNRQST